MGGLPLLVILLLFAPLPSSTLWLPFYSSSSSTQSDTNTPEVVATKGMKAEFSVQSFEDQEGRKLLEDARMKQLSLNTCWQDAYRSLFASCAEILTNEERKMRLAWQLSDCFIRDSGRPSLPSCSTKYSMKGCRKKLQDFEENIYLQFFIQTNAICHQLQANAFKRDTERLINGLKSSAELAEEKLEGLEGKTEQLLQSTSQIHESLASVEYQTQQLAQKSGNVEEQINDVLKQSEVIFEKTKGIAATQSELQEGQVQMKEKLEYGMEMLHKSYESLGDGMEMLKEEAIEIEKEINQVGYLISTKMNNLQTTADDIGVVAGASLDKQKQLLSGQEKALEDLDFLTKFQSQALEESRKTLQKLAELGHKQQEELLRQQQKIQLAHDHLLQNSQSILAAQEEFESKQANVFAALDKLFALHNAILVESRFIKSFFFFCALIFLTYMLTSAKQTSAVRARLYLGLCVTFIVELAIIRLGVDDFQKQSWIKSKVSLARSTFLLAASLQILHAIFTYRDYEVLNYRMLQELKDKIVTMEQKRGKELPSLSVENETDLYDWIDMDLPEEVNSYDDPDYMLPEEVVESSLTCSVSRIYNLRPRNCRP